MSSAQPTVLDHEDDRALLEAEAREQDEWERRMRAKVGQDEPDDPAWKRMKADHRRLLERHGMAELQYQQRRFAEGARLRARTQAGRGRGPRPGANSRRRGSSRTSASSTTSSADPGSREGGGDDPPPLAPSGRLILQAGPEDWEVVG